jgi:hypothetical protein
LSDGFELKYARINRLTREVPREDGIIRRQIAHPTDPRVWKIRIGNLVNEQERIAMRDQRLDLSAPEIHMLSCLGWSPHGATRSGSNQVFEVIQHVYALEPVIKFRLHTVERNSTNSRDRNVSVNVSSAPK